MQCGVILTVSATRLTVSTQYIWVWFVVLVFYLTCIINPRRACTARVTVVVLCVCVYVCPLIPAASHIGITKERYQQILRNTGIVLNFADFPKNASFKNYGVICLPRAAPAS